jgi:hypothetical protein
MPASTASRRKAWFSRVDLSRFVPSPIRATSVPATVSVRDAAEDWVDMPSDYESDYFFLK